MVLSILLLFDFVFILKCIIFIIYVERERDFVRLGARGVLWLNFVDKLYILMIRKGAYNEAVADGVAGI